MATYYDTYQASSDVWYSWNTGGTSTNATAYGDAWTYWTADSGTSSSSSTTNGTVWVKWASANPVEIQLGDVVIPIYPQPVQTPEEIQAAAEAVAAEAARQLQAQRERARREVEAQRLRNLAEKRAEALLLSLLNRNQRLEYKNQKQITIWKGTKKWVLAKERNYNVLEYNEEGKLIARHCVQTVGTPMADQLAAQYLYMHTNPDELIRTANHQMVH